MDVARTRRCALRAAAPSYGRRSARRQRGLTLTESLAALAIAATTATVVVPSFVDLLAANRLATRVNLFVGHLQFARSEAVKRGRRIVMCRSADGEACTAADGWHRGWIIFTDDNGNREREPNETVLRVQAPLADHTVVTSGKRRRIVFHAVGSTPGSNGTYIFCQPTRPALTRAVVLSNTGRPRLARRRPGGGPLPCP